MPGDASDPCLVSAVPVQVIPEIRAPAIDWVEAGNAYSARWRSERGLPPPKRVTLADDALSADAAYRLACEGTAILWRGDYHNATQLLQAMARRAENSLARRAENSQPRRADESQPRRADDSPPQRMDTTGARKNKAQAKLSPAVQAPADAFHRHRQGQSQRARVLGALLIPFDADYGIALRRAPDARQACAEVWGPPDAVGSVASLRELQGIIGAHEWRKKGVEIPALGDAPDNRIHPHYGVFSPVRGEYVSLVATAPLPVTGQQQFVAFDIGTGTGVLAAVLARRQIERIVATDQDPRALACARENIDRLGLSGRVQVVRADLFPEGRASLVVCNPPWLPARAGSAIEAAVYDEDSRMLLGFLRGLTAHLVAGGEGWLIMSDFAEHLGLRLRGELLAAIEQCGLIVVGRVDARPRHPKASDAGDLLHAARAAEVTSLWRLAVASRSGDWP